MLNASVKKETKQAEMGYRQMVEYKESKDKDGRIISYEVVKVFRGGLVEYPETRETLRRMGFLS